MSDPSTNVPRTAIAPANYQTLIDYAEGTNPIYVGKADPKAGQGDSTWFIIKITWDVNDNPTAIKTASGVDWTNRADYF